MSSNVSPEPIQANLGGRGPRSSRLKDTGRDPEACVGGYHLGTSNPLGKLPALFCGEICAVLWVDVLGEEAAGLGVGSVGQGGGSTKVGEEVTIGLQNVEFILGFVFVLLKS